MTPGPHSPNILMIRKLDSIFPLSEEEKQALRTLAVQVTALRADQDIVRIGDQPSQCCLLLEGFTSIYKLTAEGKRQIVGLHVPGRHPGPAEPAPEGDGRQRRHHHRLYGRVHPA